LIVERRRQAELDGGALNRHVVREVVAEPGLCAIANNRVDFGRRVRAANQSLSATAYAPTANDDDIVHPNSPLALDAL
jgi:hypothetical protein